MNKGFFFLNHTLSSFHNLKLSLLEKARMKNVCQITSLMSTASGKLGTEKEKKLVNKI